VEKHVKIIYLLLLCPIFKEFIEERAILGLSDTIMLKIVVK
jgi:hypothetical protein